MGEPEADIAAMTQLPTQAIGEALLADEGRLVEALIARARFSGAERGRIAAVATRLVEAARAGRHESGGVDSFLHEYGLSSEEGVLLLCLAEALLRIPDAATADRLIAGTIGSGDWARHLGQSESVMVNASTWGLMLTGHVVDWGEGKGNDLASLVQRLIGRSGEPVIRQALRQAMRILGNQFVLGETIEAALENAEDDAGEGYRFSFDMLGEAARTEDDARRYTARYDAAVTAIADWAGDPPDRTDDVLHQRPGLSVKLSALHPRYHPSQEARLQAELVPRLTELAGAMRAAWLPLTIDAEEAERLDLSLAMLEPLFTDPALAGWNGLGLAVQAYSKRALPLIDWLADVAEATGRRIPVRLVKGAYWDSEIKWAQEAGLADYPVFTRKVTRRGYLAAAKALLARPDCFYPQFATHNAHTIAAVAELAGNRPYEFQRLYGMGQALHREVVHPEGLGKPCRIYAPVGGHRDLLAYLVRRLLENGANTSFVNRLADDEAPITAIVADPVEKAAALREKANPSIPPPPKLFAPARKNSLGLALWEPSIRAPLLGVMGEALKAPATANPIVSGQEIETGGEVVEIGSPQDNRIVAGTYRNADPETMDAALTAAKAACEAWDRTGGVKRAEALERAADLFEADRARLMALMVREAGKTLVSAQAELREAVDFLRYYAAEARAKFEMPRVLVGPTGERNEIALHGRGVFAAISPWNFPLAIFTGQIAGALAAGNAVVAKPAEQTPLTAAHAVRLLHRAAFRVTCCISCPDAARSPAPRWSPIRADGVVFTGGTDTGLAINRALAARDGPIAKLIAETGGSNAMIVDSSALPEQVVDDALASAFDSAGQRCSALRVLFLQEDIADGTLEMLIGAARELSVGDPFDYAIDIGPVIDAEAKTMLEAHKAKMRGQHRELLDLPLSERHAAGSFVTPAIYEIPDIAVLEKEVFGPILHVVRFDGERLGDVCEAINRMGYGLTLGLHSRIKATADFVAARVKVGNFYVNRNQIGAVVGVQPFGGEGLSGTGPKAGAPRYTEAFAVERVRTTDLTASGGNASLLAAGGDE
ncbi:bifunctional proline dehydrogenase/L-glutamate gamma-semialdehyde dehydrogenase PutA [Methyloceanibacter superfactus]|uniref:bifunctional proline dehydrogenase/L-glutamate gamma-semialdehyde dehydrogenase PutA n=1 Tax=Methyloceanibacter superfactus TaxID=1774969 RepID=UPI000B2EDF31|nr:bifunctional proline dehydrogenase/L-glutamate gamma-semialdehyde dehydrogenase PutA [Methyloceanibacter superfactus]